MNTMSNHDTDFFLNLYKDIVRTEDGYRLQKTWEEGENGKLQRTSEHKNNPNQNEFTKNCARCIHYIEFCGTNKCVIRTSLENCPANSFIPSSWVANCDAYEPVFPLNIVESEKEMVNFIDKVCNFFGCPEDYEAYFGFERKWDEATGDILETVKEYYDRGGEFKDIPERYPCVVDFDVNKKQLDWIYIGEEK